MSSLVPPSGLCAPEHQDLGLLPGEMEAIFLVRLELIQSRREQGKGQKGSSSLHCVLDSPGHPVKMWVLSPWVWGWGAETPYLSRDPGHADATSLWTHF